MRNSTVSEDYFDRSFTFLRGRELLSNSSRSVLCVIRDGIPTYFGSILRFAWYSARVAGGRKASDGATVACDSLCPMQSSPDGHNMHMHPLVHNIAECRCVINVHHYYCDMEYIATPGTVHLWPCW